ncbi:MAG: hypothetical protein FJX92_02015 [Bacteroidetes bacterium]|nr:hypothetical protein [Bacteroidota bacterium]
MKKYHLQQTAFILFLLLTTASYSQSNKIKYPEASPRQNIFIELGGNGVAFNAMYESRFHKSSDGMGFKVGLGGFTGSYTKVFTLPVGINWLLTKDNKHFFEMGVGTTFLHYEDTYFVPCGIPTSHYPVDVAGLTVDQKNSVFGHLTLGYRRQPSAGGIMWGIAVTPHFNENGFWPVWFGIKFGYSFARK